MDEHSDLRHLVPLENWKVRRVAEGRTAPGESVLWADSPSPSRRWRETVGILLLGVPGMGIALILMWLTPGVRGQPRYLNTETLSQLPLFLVFLGIASLPFWACSQARLTTYAITDRRILIIDGMMQTFKVYGPEQMYRLCRSEYPDGTGSLVFAQKFVPDTSLPSLQDIQFRAIRDVRLVERLVRHTFKGRSAGQ